jgi:hypothetical protein
MAMSKSKYNSTKKSFGRTVKNNWTEECLAQEVLDNLFKSGEVSGDEPASAVYHMDAIFEDYEPPVFNSHYYQTKKKWRAINGANCKL